MASKGSVGTGALRTRVVHAYALQTSFDGIHWDLHSIDVDHDKILRIQKLMEQIAAEQAGAPTGDISTADVVSAAPAPAEPQPTPDIVTGDLVLDDGDKRE